MLQSPVDGKPMLLTPEESIQIQVSNYTSIYIFSFFSFNIFSFFSSVVQNRIGADIIMALDDVIKTTITGPRVEEATYRTLRWIDRCIAGNPMVAKTTILLYCFCFACRILIRVALCKQLTRGLMIRTYLVLCKVV